jgi:threonine aldolase
VIFHVDPAWGPASVFAEKLASHGVRSMAFSPTSIRLVTHLDVDSQAIERACQAIEAVAKRD